MTARLFPQSNQNDCVALREDGTCILNNARCQYCDKYNCESHNVYVILNSRAIVQMQQDENVLGVTDCKSRTHSGGKK